MCPTPLKRSSRCSICGQQTQVYSYKTPDRTGRLVTRSVRLCNTCDMTGDWTPEEDELKALYDL